ncbi:adenosylcobinamide-GDP ribazoletransferase [Paenibacillus sp. OAS669]|uniref:adenosylcobinamide-GDP ribazoletransferase n=1 Tax=Paenibacillus sp. OAS669 TaxID=2663821 RepID=UPI0019F90396|nr:adenosylcobinamide-GDP ribazoletransferase [Paenibacillus sp. OAS669]MBE1441556.1 cobalamin 5'-phosphate synthase/cobalamin synthase [Paenibacillus sp. OAS669]
MRILLDFMVKGLAACAAAFQFLTRLPVPVTLEYNDALFRRSVVFYPLVGAVMGLLLGAAGWLLQGWLPPGVTSALLLALWVAMTGGLHLDGLMDTADGIFSYRSREKMLEIMKDSRVGAMGVIACVLVLLCKWTLLQQWLPLSWAGSLFVLPLAALWSRWYMVVAIAFWPYARQEETGHNRIGAFFRGLQAKHVILHTGLALLLTCCLVWMMGESLLFSVLIIGAAALGCLAAGVSISVFISRKLGGLTGDTYGAINELLEVFLLLLLYMVIHS